MAKYLRQVPCCLVSKLTMGSSRSKLSQLSTCRRASKSRKTETVMKTVPVVMGTRTFRFAGTHTKKPFENTNDGTKGKYDKLSFFTCLYI